MPTIGYADDLYRFMYVICEFVMLIFKRCHNLLKHESAVGVLLLLSAILAMIVSNSPLEKYYDLLLSVPITVAVGSFSIIKPVLLWVNDGLMALFFLLIGLEVKREFLIGELSQKSQVILPAAGALGGMVVPAAIYILFNYNDKVGMNGWAIPTATDIAFSLGVLALLGSRVPSSLKIFLMALAIMDDLGAIIIIAVFYTTDLSLLSIVLASVCLVSLIIFNRIGVARSGVYMTVGVIMWACVLKSGVHATLAGVALAFTIPINIKNANRKPLLISIEHSLHDSVNYWIIPIFAFMNAGVSVSLTSMSDLINPTPLGIILGLFIGKQVGIFGFVWITIKLGFSRLPKGANWMHIYGLSILCGIGFTMSLFVGSLAFDKVGEDYIIASRTSILIGSLLSAVVAYIILRFCAHTKPMKVETSLNSQ